MRKALLATTAIVAAANLLGMALAVSCGSTDSSSGADCHAGDQLACTCGDGAKGLKACEDGKFAPCVCNPPDGGGDGAHEGGPSMSDAGFGEYLGKCNVTADCPDGDICFLFMSKGMFCTKQCTSSDECPPPSPKCNPKGVCAVPD